VIPDFRAAAHLMPVRDLKNVLAALPLVPAARAQESAQPTQTAVVADITSDSDAQKNIQECIELAALTIFFIL
jgi:arginine decarboxylase-like protein